MHFLLPLIMEQLRDADSDISTKALVVLRHMVHVTGEETVASIAPQLSAELLLLFDVVRLGEEPGPLPVSWAGGAALRQCPLCPRLLRVVLGPCSAGRRAGREGDRGLGAASTEVPPLPSHQDAVQVRVLSTRLFRDVLAIVLGTKDQQLQKQVRSSLLPLLFHMEDESRSVRQVWLSNQGPRRLEAGNEKLGMGLCQTCFPRSLRAPPQSVATNV